MSESRDRVTLNEKQQLVLSLVVDEAQDVNAVSKAGVGKTEMLLGLSRKWATEKKSKCLLLTYNTRLKEQLREKVGRMSQKVVKFIDAENIHSLALRIATLAGWGKYQSETEMHENVIKDAVACLQRLRAKTLDAPAKLAAYLDSIKLIGADEMQDLTEAFAAFLKEFFLCCPGSRIVLCGDPLQKIYEDADPKMLVTPNVELSETKRSFVRVDLNQSYRFCRNILCFLKQLDPNNLVPSDFIKQEEIDLLKSYWGPGFAEPTDETKPGGEVFIMKRDKNCYNDAVASDVLKEHKKMVQKFGSTNVAVLATTIKDTSPVGHMVRFSCSDRDNAKPDASLDEDQKAKWAKEKREKEDALIQQKWRLLDSKRKTSSSSFDKRPLVSTIHQVKGDTFKAGVFAGFDTFHLHTGKFKMNFIQLYCLVYTAVTRFSDSVLLLASMDAGSNIFPTLKTSSLDKSVKFLCEGTDSSQSSILSFFGKAAKQQPCARNVKKRHRE